jgi:hypothetical protein
MKYIIIAMVLGSAAHAADTKAPQFTKVAPTMTKYEAAKLLLADKSTVIYRCQQVEMNDKLSIVNKKIKK